MTQSTQAGREGVAQLAGRILIAWRTGDSTVLSQELEYAQFLASLPAASGMRARPSTLEMETMEVLSGVVETLRSGRERNAGAVRLLEHLATTGAVGESKGARLRPFVIN